MIAKKLLGCIAPTAQAQCGFLATWNGAAGSAPVADIGGAADTGSVTSTGSGSIIVPAGSGVSCSIASIAPMSQNAWVVDMFFMVDGANLAPPIFFVSLGEPGTTLASMYQGTLSVGGNAIATPSMSAGLHHLAIGRQSGGYSAWIDGARVIDAAAPPPGLPGEISLTMYGAGVSSISSYPCEWGNVRATAGELYSGPTISVPTLPLVAV